MSSIPTPSWVIKADDPLALTQVLDLPEFVVTQIEHVEQAGYLVIGCHVAAASAVCPRCAQRSWQIHQLHPRRVRDRSWSGLPTYLEFAARRFKCRCCRRPFTEPLAGLASHARTTCRYAQALVANCQEQSLQAVAQREHLGYKAVERAYYHAAATACPAIPTHPIRRLGIDEIATQKGRGHYRLVLSDLATRRVVAVLPDRQQATLEAYLTSWSPELRAAVHEVALDLWLPYHQAVRAQLPQARITADRFHVMQNLLSRCNEARRLVQRTLPKAQRQLLKGHYKLLNKNAVDLQPDEQAVLQMIAETVPELGQLHEVKEQFRAIFEQAADRTSAATRLEHWITTVQALGNESLNKFVRTLQTWWEVILNYFASQVSSGPVEGLNNKIKLVLRRAFGLRNFDHLRLRIMRECAGTLPAH